MLIVATVLLSELRRESVSVIRCATSVCPDVALQLITQSIDEEINQSLQPGQSSAMYLSHNAVLAVL